MTDNWGNFDFDNDDELSPYDGQFEEMHAIESSRRLSLRYLIVLGAGVVLLIAVIALLVWLLIVR